MGGIAGIKNRSPLPYETRGGGGVAPGDLPFVFAAAAGSVQINVSNAAIITGLNSFNAGRDSVGGAPGVTGNFAVVLGGDLAGIGGATGNYSTVGGGYGGLASGDYATVLGGASNQATGEYSTACGYTSKATGAGSVAMGYQVTAAGNNSSAFGFMSTANGDNSNATNSGVANGQWSTANGTGITGVNGTYASARGFGTQANFLGDEASGIGSIAQSANVGGAAARNIQTQALADGATAGGIGSIATRTGEDAFASGQIVAAGDAQRKHLNIVGQNTGSASALLYGTGTPSEQFTLVEGASYTIVVEGNVTSGTDTWWIQTTLFVAYPAGGGAIEFPTSPGALPTLTPNGSGVDSTNNGGALAPITGGWQIAITDGGGGELVFTASQTAGPTTIKCNLHLRYIETQF